MLRFTLLLLAVAVQAVLSYRSVCYYTNWAQYRHSKGTYKPEDIDPKLCTHIIYAFAKIVGTDVVAFEWNDESTNWSKGMYERTMAMKNSNPSLKIMLGVGGWNMASPPFMAIVGDAQKRSDFANNLLAFIKKHGFDGFDNDWEYPGARGSPPEDKNNDVLFMQEIRRVFDADSARTGNHLLLSTAISVGKSTIDGAYDVPRLSSIVDFFNIMSYDIHGSFEPYTGHNSPLFAGAHETGKDRYLNVDWAINYYTSLGMPRDKMNMGIPTYGRSFTLDNPSSSDVGAPASQPGQAGRFTNEKGFISYYEICEMLQSGAQVYSIPSQHAKYLVKGSQWVGYDDVQSVTEKACYAKQAGIGGLMYWALDLDDFKGTTCNEGRYPLISAANNEFQSPDYSHCPTNVPAPQPVTNGPYVPPVTNAPYVPPVTNAPYVPPVTNGPYVPPVTNGPYVPPVTNGPYVPPVTNGPYVPPATYRPPVTYNPFITQAPPATAAPYTQPPQHIPSLGAGFSCQGKINDFYADPNHCDSFFICANQQAFRVDCAQGLMYNTALKHCDWAKNVQCGFQTTPPPFQPVTYRPNTQRPVQTIAPATRAPITAAPWTAPPATRAPWTAAPVTRAPITAAPWTAAPWTAAPWTAAPVTGAPVTARPQVTAVPGVPGNNFSCKNQGDGIYRHGDCRKYIQCSGGNKFVMTCPNQLLFNPNLGSCDFAINVPSCFTG